MVQYAFKYGIERPIVVKQRGNSRATPNKPFVRTWSSTKEAIKDASHELNPREVVQNVVTDDLGGLASCFSFGQLPRNR